MRAIPEGSHFIDVDDNEYIDYLCGLGPIILGYCYPRIDEAIKNQLKSGILFSLPHKLELDVSELVCSVVPSADMVKFSKNHRFLSLSLLIIFQKDIGFDRFRSWRFQRPIWRFLNIFW